MSTARATIRDIASEAGVSIATVSRVLNGRPDVSAETREAVLTVVRERGFTTNRSARALSGGRTGLVGLAVPFMHGPYFAPILSGAAEALYEQDTRIVVCSTHHRHDREVTLLDRLMHGTTDGAILLLPEETNAELLALQRQGFPFVVADPRVTPAEGIASVSAANASGAKAATEHLLSLGHRRIGAVTGIPGMVANDERLNGFHAGLVAAGLVPDASLEVSSDWRIEGGAEAALRLLDRPDRPTAVVAFNDNVAVGTMRAARALGVRVPEELSIVGFDDVEFSELVAPALTTVRQPLEEMGRMAVSLLTRLIERQPVEALHVELATRLVVRESTAPPPR